MAKMGGIYRAELKDYGRAVDCFEQYEREYPDGPTLWGCLYELGQSYEELGERAKALAAYQRAYDVSGSAELREA